MALSNLPAKYYNRFDIKKNYNKLLFLSGQGLQAAELNEIQETILAQLERYATRLVKNGTIMSGGEIVNLAADEIGLAAAEVSINGTVLYVPAASVDITGVGIEIIGVSVTETLVVDTQDPTIRESDPESPNYQQPGAFRYQRVATWINGTNLGASDTFFPIISMEDGQVLSNAPSTDNTALITSLIGAYDRDTRGSYVISGLNVLFTSLSDDDKAVNLLLTSGVARIQGNHINKTSGTDFELEPLTDLEARLGEPYTFTAIGDYVLRNGPVESIQLVQGTKQIGTSTVAPAVVTHGGFSGSSDLLPNTPVLSILSVNQGGTWNGTTFVGGTNYTVNTDYIQDGDNISWAPGGAEPSPGSTYQVVFRYISSFIPEVNTAKTGITIGSDNTLVAGTSFSVNYKYYLKRTDRLVLTATGLLKAVRGTPGYTNFYAPAEPSGTLSLATISMTYDQPATVTTDTTLNLNSRDLKRLVDDVESVKYNIAQLSLIENARSTDPTTSKRNLVVDPLYDGDMLDAGAVPANSAGIVGGVLSMKSVISTISSASDTNNIYTLPYNNVLFQSQERATGGVKINPYATPTAPRMATALVTPGEISQARFVEWNDTVSTGLPTSVSVRLNASGFNNGETVRVTFRGQVTNVVASAQGAISTTLTVPSGTASGSYAADVLGLTSLVTGSTLVRVATNVTRGAQPAPKVITVTKTVIQPVAVYGYGGFGYNGFFGNGLFGGGVVATRTCWGKWTYGWNWGYNDPVAQTFVVDKDRALSAVGIAFAELPGDDVVIKVVKARLGIPDKDEIVGITRISRASIIALGANVPAAPANLNIAGSAGAVAGSWIRADFMAPINLDASEEYAIIVVCSQNTGAVRVATVGAIDQNGAVVQTQTAGGVLLTSANESTWTPAQNQDMCYRLYEPLATMTTQTTTLITVAATGATDWLMTHNDDLAPGTNAKYTLVLGATSYEITSGNYLYTAPYTGNAILRVTLSTTNNNVLPIVGNVILQHGVSNGPAYYTMRAFNIPNGSTTPATIKVLLKEYKPSGTSITPKVETATNTFTDMTFVSGSPVGDGFQESVYTITGVNLNTSRLRILLDSTNASRPLVQNIRILIS